jgi:flagellin
MSVINTNVKSLVAQNALTVNGRAMSKTMEQLSTGKRINSAADDAAGLAISTKMTSQIRGLNQAVRNANDGISLLQTAEGATVEITNMLQRMRELAVQSATDTNTTADRSYLDDEYQQLKAEINRIADNTQWNGMDILDGNDLFGTVANNEQTVSLHVGANSSQVIDVNFKNMTFTAASSAVSESVTTINFAGVVGEDATARFKGTFGTVAVDINLSTSLTADIADGEIDSLATEMQTAIRQYSGLENIVVSSANEILTITDSTGKAHSSFGFFKTDGTTDSTPLALIEFANGTPTNGAAPAGGLFTANLAGSSVTTKSDANSAIGFLDTAIESVSDERSKFGSVMNRLSYAIDNLNNISSNASASRSRIQDTDYAQATTELARTQIIQQAATAMLAQANQQPSSVLSLLQ